MLASFATTIAVARGVNYARERRRPDPMLRSLARRLKSAPRTDGLRIHHFLPGIGTALAAGTLAIVTRSDGWEAALSVPFGIGTALTADELAILVKANNPYWSSEGLAAAQAAAAALAAAGLGVGFVRRGGGAELLQT